MAVEKRIHIIITLEAGRQAGNGRKGINFI